MKNTNGNHPSRSATAENLFKLYTEELRDLYWAEKHLVKALPKMAKAAESPNLAKAFQSHLKQTQNHIVRLEEVFALSDLKVSARKCEAMEGLVEEGGALIEEHDAGSVRDAGLIIAAQKVEHYEMAAYGSLRTLARVMDLPAAATLLQETLDEEGDTDKHLTTLAETINEEAYTETEVVEEEN